MNTMQWWQHELKDKQAGGKELPAVCQSTKAVEWLKTHDNYTCVYCTVCPAASTKEKDGIINSISFIIPHHFEVLQQCGYLSVINVTHDMNCL